MEVCKKTRWWKTVNYAFENGFLFTTKIVKNKQTIKTKNSDGSM